jgi:protein gp37
MNRTSIGWTEQSWNPVCGCSIISPGCHHCYAMMMAARLKRIALSMIAEGKEPGKLRHYIDVIGPDGRWNGNVKLIEEALGDPAEDGKRRFVFVNSMSDTFHEKLTVADIRRVCETMRDVNHHTYQVLTKRADRMTNPDFPPDRFVATYSGEG